MRVFEMSLLYLAFSSQQGFFVLLVKTHVLNASVATKDL